MSLKNKIITVICEKIVFPGRSLCRCDDGIALFTEGLLPDKHADVLVVRDKKSFREGLVKKITFKSSKRMSPLCPSFGVCGGCSFQNTSYTNQIKYKQEYVSELLDFTGIEISKILISPNTWFYRNKMEFSFFCSSRDCLVEGNFKTGLGLHCRGSFNKYVSVPPCFIADKDFLRATEIVKKFANKNNIPAYNNKTHEGFFRHLVLRKAGNNNQLLINIVTNNTNQEQLFLEPLVKELADFTNSIYWTINSRKSDAVVSDKTTLMYGKPYITEKLSVGGRDYFFNISPLSFFQTNSKGTEVLYNEVLRLLNPSKEDVLLDLYCGTGTIGISMAHNVKKVVGIEQVEQSIENAKENAVANNVSNAEFYTMTAEQWVNQNVSIFDIIVVDPPRSGLTKDVVNFLVDSNAKRIVYVSCNPSTLARDLQIIIGKNIYSVKKIIPIDMFPQTHHVEIVVLLELK
ncbi:MAG: 23S rRNA (uracil(1939)-C(5))-methyltransferase RlmD [Endomicrobium sp.]|jgi:23S rRNA (uracil-5-)-methyltransferase RumA|nr:23S rRNA (uracil(1939)-C(5))-methyltransferase RlmD [Endomicrobium sp.]